MLSRRQRSGAAADLEFTLWKAIGDELIFTCPVRSEIDVYTAVRLWIAAMDEYARSNLDPGSGLGVKGAAFLGTFPGPDHEATIPRRPGDEESGRDVVVLNQEAVSAPHRDTERYLFDYLGPNIDTGFRIAELSTARHLPVSIEVAYALAAVHNHHDGPSAHYRSPDLRLLDSLRLKGVWGGREYPVFAIDLEYTDPIHRALADLRNDRHDNAAILQLCAQVYAARADGASLYLPRAVTPVFTAPPADPLTAYLATAPEGLLGVEAPAPDEGEGRLPPDAPVD